MERYKSNADNSTFNGTLNAATDSTPANVPRDGSIMSRIQELQATYEKLGHSYSAPFPANAGSGERMADVVNSSTQAVIPDKFLHFTKELQAAYQEHGLEIENKVSEALLEFLDCMKNVNAGWERSLEISVFYSRIKLHKNESAKSTCLKNKEHCCICLDDYCDGEELAKIDYGHVYHADCIQEWIKLETSCPICKRDALAFLT
ncbi:hypothetical protein K7X08_030950 [Anisodus acutangulus]|uniref:RING-type E3 ubiquitin transferase n=1 Tax=Anisodus acutangulus TaxID=402998 RepID=A0A9Q1MY46_9SOLA|nr:hypothetical protein K7X08_030950 [Anisodus acutangulus]